MNWNDGLTKLKDSLANMGYNILGYEHTQEQKNQLEPWFYPKKKKQGLPPEVGEFSNNVKNTYPVAACKKKKAMGQQNVDIFCGIKADGLSIEQLQSELKKFEKTFYKADEEKFPKKTVKIGKKKAAYIGLTLCFIYESGLPEDKVNDVKACWKKQKLRSPRPRNMYSTRPYIIDLANKRVEKHKGTPLKTNAPGPNKLSSMLFS